MERTLKAVTLGTAACGAALAFGFTVAGFAWFVTSWVMWSDHCARDWTAFVPAVSFGLLLALSAVAALGFGWCVGRDWYRNGR
jgi:membrane-associated PAP2 superfamily phosphatase